jgi:hypothetical protein
VHFEAWRIREVASLGEIDERIEAFQLGCTEDARAFVHGIAKCGLQGAEICSQLRRFMWISSHSLMNISRVCHYHLLNTCGRIPLSKYGLNGLIVFCIILKDCLTECFIKLAGQRSILPNFNLL